MAQEFKEGDNKFAGSVRFRPGPDSGYEATDRGRGTDFDRNFEKGISSGATSDGLRERSSSLTHSTRCGERSWFEVTRRNGQVESDPVVVAVTVSE